MKKNHEPDYWLPKAKKRQLRAEARLRDYDSMTDARRIRRSARRKIRTGELFGIDLPKPGRFVSAAFKSSRRYVRAYSYARSEAEFYDMARYADY